MRNQFLHLQRPNMLGNELSVVKTGLDPLDNIRDEFGKILTLGQVDQSRQLRAPPVVSAERGGGVGEATVIRIQTTELGLGRIGGGFS